jgi:hypothetical protein
MYFKNSAHGSPTNGAFPDSVNFGVGGVLAASTGVSPRPPADPAGSADPAGLAGSADPAGPAGSADSAGVSPSPKRVLRSGRMGRRFRKSKAVGLSSA